MIYTVRRIRRMGFKKGDALMTCEIAQGIKSGEIELWKYDVRNKESNSNDFKNTIGEIKTSSIWKGERKGQYSYYGFRFDKEKYYVVIDASGSFEVLNYIKNQKQDIGMNYEEICDIVSRKEYDADKMLKKIHIWQNLFKKNWIILFGIQIVSFILFRNNNSYDDAIPALIATYIATILAMEDCFVICAKRFQAKRNRILMRGFGIGIVFYDLWIIMMFILTCSCSNFYSNETLISELVAIGTGLSLAVTVGVLLIRKDAMSRI